MNSEKNIFNDIMNEEDIKRLYKNSREDLFLYVNFAYKDKEWETEYYTLSDNKAIAIFLIKMTLIL